MQPLKRQPSNPTPSSLRFHPNTVYLPAPVESVTSKSIWGLVSVASVAMVTAQREKEEMNTGMLLNTVKGARGGGGLQQEQYPKAQMW